MATKLLICGSRRISRAMFKTAVKAVKRAKERGFEIVVGDADGIDSVVMSAACVMGVPFKVYGIAQYPRHVCCPKHAAESYVRVPGDYLGRDRRMVHKADMVFAVWNGTSRGTRYTYNYALECNKQAWLWEERKHDGQAQSASDRQVSGHPADDPG